MTPYDNSVRVLAEGFSSEFAEMCAGNERMHELMMDLAAEFVQTNVPIVSEDSQIDLAAELMMRVTVREV